MMEFHIAREARDRYQVSDTLFNYVGNVIFGDLSACRQLAYRMSEVRGKENPVHPGALFAMGLIDEVSHAVVAQYRKSRDPQMSAGALEWFTGRVGEENVERLLRGFAEEFPNVALYRGETTLDEWLNGTADGLTHREAVLEEIMLLWLANVNPAFQPFRELYDDSNLAESTSYRQITAELRDYFATRPETEMGRGNLLDLLRAPTEASPDSLSGQLAWIRQNWSQYLGEHLHKVLLATDVLKEEEIAIWMRFHPPSAHRHHRPFEFGREYEAPAFSHHAGDVEYERFSPDQDWMPNVVMIAKSTYVWLAQLSRQYGRAIERLDQIPDEELELLTRRGMNALWLIGVWERSQASQTIKRLRGQDDAVASAYSLDSYRIADDLGGDYAYDNLRDRAARYGIRLASDMVPNHMGIDSPWLVEHPEWFLSRQDMPYPGYRFDGPNLSHDGRVEIKIEDHYYDQSDAAVVFRRRDNATGQMDYVYHGNDGTSFPWNDTAQLNYLRADVREQVIQTILHVARLFPIIRFDAAMTLARRHVQRLWFPLPGSGGSIPSRAECAMTQAQFDAALPHEFWREVVDRVAAEVPGTLLLAEAFWMLEGYFVRTLGMHRVYNSAFMNMVRDEENAKYRGVLKDTIEFDPDILKRYVNFMSNPDERTAIDQFGTGDKYFGVCTMMATLPGLPMFGHGQIEAFTEKYGMEYKRPRYEETANPHLVERHQREIAPLLRNRHVFAESANFALFDFWREDGTVDENVFAWSNRAGNQSALVVYHNKYAGTAGTLHESAARSDKKTGVLSRVKLHEALDLSRDEETILAYQDSANGLHYLRRARDLREQGLFLRLDAYQYHVFQNWRELHASEDYPWDVLCTDLNGSGVWSLEDALARLKLRPVHAALRQALEANRVRRYSDLAEMEDECAGVASRTVRTPAAMKKTLDEMVKDAEPFLREAFATLVGEGDACETDATEVSRACVDEPGMELVCGGPAVSRPEPDRFADALDSYRALLSAAAQVPQLEQSGAHGWPPDARVVLPSYSPTAGAAIVWAPVAAWCLMRVWMDLLPEEQDRGEAFDRLYLRSALAEIFEPLGLEADAAYRAAARVRVLLASHATVGASELDWDDPDVAWLTGLHDADGHRYFNKEAHEQLLWWLWLPKMVQLIVEESAAGPADVGNVVNDMEACVEKTALSARDAGYKLDVMLARSTHEKARLTTSDRAKERFRGRS